MLTYADGCFPLCILVGQDPRMLTYADTSLMLQDLSEVEEMAQRSEVRSVSICTFVPVKQIN
jgi:hypothetical protein